ncbi:MAG: tetratricopeptide repeat protein [Gemmatirosa sp.]
MDAARWAQVQALFHDAADRPADERAAFVTAATSDDPVLAAHVLALLDEDARAHALLDGGLARAAHDVLATPATLPLEAFGAYHLRRVLGEGGMGVVYLAERDDLRSVAAIKILRDAWLSPARRERFAIEQRTLAQLNHPSIARLFDAGTLPDGTPWFVMEYVQGEAITAHCARRDATLTERLRLFREVCEAVQHAHRHAIIHRDLKPSNILVTEDGTVKLLDFGIAKQLEEAQEPDDGAHTRTGLRAMTPAYAAPEQLRGERVGLHTDVYALGVVLYELLTNRLPFDAASHTPQELAAHVTAHVPDRPSQVAPRDAGPLAGVGRATWGELDVLCLTALHADPQRRYRTVEALARDVDHLVQGRPLDARPDSWRYRLGKLARRRWRPLSAAGAVLALILALSTVYTLRLADARNAALADAARTQRIQRFMLALFEGGDQSAGPADSLRVVTLVDRGVEEARALGHEPIVQAELYGTLGDIARKLGQLPRADSLLQLTLARRRALEGAAHPDVAASEIALGLLRLDQARLDEAEALVRAGLARTRRTLPPDHPAVPRALVALGRVLEERGRYDDAVRALEEAATHLDGGGAPTPELAEALHGLSNVHFYAGRFGVADSISRRVLAISRALYGERHPHVAMDLVNIGAVQFERGRYPEAERYYREELAITEPWYGPAHPQTAAGLTMLGRALVYQARYDEASPLLERAVAVQARVYGPSHPRVASLLNELGNVALKRGQLDAAEANFGRMRDIYRAVHGDRHYLIGIAVSNLGGVQLERKQYVRAESLYRDAVARFTAAQSADHLNTGIGRIKLGRALARQGRWTEAERETLGGYQILVTQTDPAVSFLQAARRDLIAVYDTTGQREKAARFRAELAAAEKPAPTPGGG